jgi:hypothetical protein
MAGQPKATAEYIQATSRVGRGTAGIVFTVYNWARPRDLSLYESFRHYHATLCRQVEALSVMPYSAGAVRSELYRSWCIIRKIGSPTPSVRLN